MLQRYKMYQETNKSILIIKSEFASLLSSETYMSKREWTMRTTHKLTEAILYITRYQPKFIMISIDHENKNIRGFIRMLMQSFPDRVIVYAEKPHVLTYHYFNEIGSSYNIYPPVSGPAIERTLLAYYKGQLSQGTPEIRIFKGPQWNKLLENEHWMYKGKKPVVEKQLISNAKARELLTLVGEELPVAPAELKALKDKKTAEENSAVQTEKKAKALAASEEAKENRKKALSAVQEQNEKAGKALSATQEQPLNSVKTTQSSKEGTPFGEVKTIETEGSSGSAAVLAASIEAALSDSHRSIVEHEENVLRGFHHESLISRAAQEALEKTVNKTHSAFVERVGNTSEMSCIVVESTRFEGYLVAAIGHNREPEENFIQGLRQRIFHFLRVNGEHINEDDEPMLVTLKKVDFKGWADAEAEFLRRSEHNQEEVSIAFFPRNNIHAHFEDSADVKMVKIKMEDLKADVPVDFNLYIYLEENQRYVRYTAKGNKFQAHQKARLERQGMRHMHVFKEELAGFNKYRAQNYLNEKIDSYHSAQRDLLPA